MRRFVTSVGEVLELLKPEAAASMKFFVRKRIQYEKEEKKVRLETEDQ